MKEDWDASHEAETRPEVHRLREAGSPCGIRVGGRHIGVLGWAVWLVDQCSPMGRA